MSNLQHQGIDRPLMEPAPWVRLGFSRSHTYDLMREQAFPLPLKVGQASRWITAEVDAWFAARKAERDAKKAERDAKKAERDAKKAERDAKKAG